MKKTTILLTLLLVLVSTLSHAQLSKSDADNLIKNIVNNDTTVVIYGLSESISRGTNIMTADGVELENPYDNAYVYFIDDNPAANWAHACRYCFINTVTVAYTVLSNHMYPNNFNDYEKLLGNTMSSTPWTGNPLPMSRQATPDDHLWAVLICSYADENVERFWGDLSCVYTALTNQFGYIENENPVNYFNILYFNHIIVFAPDEVISNKPLDLNNSGGYSNNDFITENQVFAGNNEIVYDKASIQEVFDNLSGNSNSLYDYGYRPLDSLDKLFVFVTGHGHTTNNNSHSYIYTGKHAGIYETLYDYEMADMVKDIECSQMTFLIQSCYGGGFVDDLMNTSNVKCKNRVVQTATSYNRYSHCECYINPNNNPVWPLRTGDDYQICEFTYYWCSALLGYYPIIRLDQNPIIGPWSVFENNRIGSFPWDLFFDETSTLNHDNYDVSPDYNYDGIVSMDEAFRFARNLDSWDTMGYYNPYYSMEENGLWVAADYPQSSYESGFTRELITLNGYKGNINNDVSTGVGHKYILDGDVTVCSNASLTINDECEFVGNEHIIRNYGVLTTAQNVNRVTFKNVGLLNDQGLRFSLSNCVFDTCGRIRTIDGPFSLSSSLLRQTYVNAITNNPPRDAYSVDIVDDTIITTEQGYAIRLDKVPYCNITGNTISSGGDGIYLNGLNGTYSNYVLSNNYIHDCVGNGIVAYGSNGRLYNNRIKLNGLDGIRSLNYSSLHVRGDSTASYTSQTQQISRNEECQVYATNNSYPQDFHYNSLVGNGNNPDFILCYESNNPQGIPPVVFNVKRNCWDPLLSSGIPLHLKSTGNSVFDYSPLWQPTGIITPPADLENRLTLGNELMVNGYYDGAKEVFVDLIYDYPESSEAIAAMKALFSLEVENDGDFHDLKDYYLDLLSDDYLGDAADHLANKCDVMIGNYTDAIRWYENKIVDPNTSYSERIFAEIDLGDIYLMLGDNVGRGVNCSMPQYIPASREAHDRRTGYLLSLLPGNVEPIARSNADSNGTNYGVSASDKLSCSPNPASDKTALSFTLDGDSDVEICLLDLYGKEIKHIKAGRLSRGAHSRELDVSGIADGVYFINIKTDGSNKGSAKIVVKH